MEREKKSIPVLLIDDSETNRLVGRSLLQQLGHSVDTAINGKEALSVIEQKNYSLILMDLHMDGMDGEECTKHIREKYGNSNHYIVGLSASNSEEDRQALIASGVDDYVQKPLTSNRLKEVLDRMMHKKGREGRQETLATPRPLEENLNGDKELMQKYSTYFRANYPQLINTIEASIEAKERVKTKLAIHNLRGLSGYLGNEELINILEEMETLSGQGDFEKLENLLPRAKKLLKEADNDQ